MGTARRTQRTRRLTADDWIEEAARVITESGVGAVAVEPLAQRLGVTKGSFYWHFANRDALLEATLERWERDVTEAAIVELDGIADPRERLRQLIVRALEDVQELSDAAPPEIGFGHAFHLALSDAAADPIVRPVLERVSERRVDYLEACFAGVGLTPQEARQRALFAYAAYIGTLRLFREAPSRAPAGAMAQTYQQQLVAAFLPPGDAGEDDRASHTASV